jgi:prepilin-type N-terminal cleavage/methylation domain-containing protein
MEGEIGYDGGMKSPARGKILVRGFTLIESLIGTALLVIFFTALGTVMQVSAEIIGEARLRSSATRILQERMELIKNMSYIQVGTVGGIPSGTLLQEEAVMVNSLEFTLLTSVVYIDDPSDGVAPVR